MSIEDLVEVDPAKALWLLMKAIYFWDGRECATSLSEFRELYTEFCVGE